MTEITNTWIEEGCIVCGLCETIAPNVFEIKDEGAVVREGVNFSEWGDSIREAADGCPVEVIKFTIQ